MLGHREGLVPQALWSPAQTRIHLNMGSPPEAPLPPSQVWPWGPLPHSPWAFHAATIPPISVTLSSKNFPKSLHSHLGESSPLSWIVSPFNPQSAKPPIPQTKPNPNSTTNPHYSFKWAKSLLKQIHAYTTWPGVGSEHSASTVEHTDCGPEDVRC